MSESNEYLWFFAAIVARERVVFRVGQCSISSIYNTYMISSKYGENYMRYHEVLKILLDFYLILYFKCVRLSNNVSKHMKN